MSAYVTAARTVNLIGASYRQNICLGGTPRRQRELSANRRSRGMSSSDRADFRGASAEDVDMFVLAMLAATGGPWSLKAVVAPGPRVELVLTNISSASTILPAHLDLDVLSVTVLDALGHTVELFDPRSIEERPDPTPATWYARTLAPGQSVVLSTITLEPSQLRIQGRTARVSPGPLKVTFTFDTSLVPKTPAVAQAWRGRLPAVDVALVVPVSEAPR